MKVLFLDQSSHLGGAELCLVDIVQSFDKDSLVAIFNDGAFPRHLRQFRIPVKILSKQTLQVRKDSNMLDGFKSLGQLLSLVTHVAQLSQDYDLIYVNTPKALVVGAIASFLSRRRFVYHLHDIISPDHFSVVNRRIMIALANRADLVIANSQATKAAFVGAGGTASLVQVVYNGFSPESYQVDQDKPRQLRQQLNCHDKLVVGSFSRLSPWKGQHILIEALTHCPDNVVALFVGDALFGEQDYVAKLQQLVETYHLCDRVYFLGFRSDVASLMHACNIVVHTSTAPEPFGRVIVEAMLCQRPVIAAQAGGAVELVEHNKTGWLCPPNEPEQLADLIKSCLREPEKLLEVSQNAYQYALNQFNLECTNSAIKKLLDPTVL